MRLSKLSKKTLILILSLIFFIYSSFNQQFSKQPSISKNLITTTPSSQISEIVKVTRVIDGDTIEIETKQKIRYIGVDTPELHDPRKPVQCFGYEAMVKNKELVEGKMVRLEKDVSETDRYKRLLRFVYLENLATTSAIFINDFLVRQGYARIDTVPPDVKFAGQFLQAQREAIENNRGLWSKCR